MTTSTFILRDEDQSILNEAIKSGRYDTPSDVISDALAEFHVRQEIRRMRIAEVKEKIQAGIDQLDRGESAEWNTEYVKAKGRALMASRHAVA